MDGSQGGAGAGPPLLTTKLHVPAWRPGLVSRPRLAAALERNAGRKLTLISAPAGFGKTTLLAEWLAAPPSGDRAVAWVSLDRGDNDPNRFWAYVLSAVQAQLPDSAGHALSRLHAVQSPPIESVLTVLINDVSTVTGNIVLVLDDLHLIESRPIHEAIGFLLDHLPPQLQLVITTRADPPLPLARLRARGELTEFRAADLRFTVEEAAGFFNETMGLRLSVDDVAALETRTEGWIAGLQLAALSLRGHEDVSDFVRTFAGDHRHVVDYLVEEVLQQQDEAVRRFLLQTSILDRLSGPLCDAVTGQGDSGARLEELERGNFFVVPLDDRRHWYRYHHLFADVLHARLRAEYPGLEAGLHLSASQWFEQQGMAAEAIRHAMAAGDTARAAGLVERAATAMRRSRQEATLLGWLTALPEEELRRRPVLNAVYAGVLLSNGSLKGVTARLREVEQWLDAAGAPKPPGHSRADMVVVDDDEFRRLPGSIAVYHAGHALAVGDMDTTLRSARRALELVPVDDHLYRGAASAILGLATWAEGNLDPAYESYADGMTSLQQAGYVTDTIGGVIALGDIRIAQGRLNDAMSIYQDALHRATGYGGPVLRGAADMHVGMAGILVERNELETAAERLTRSTELGEHAGFPQNPYRWRVVMARIRAAHGDLDAAIELIQDAERRYVSDMFPNVRPLAALKARLWIATGRLDDALGWARAQRLSADVVPSYLREYEQLTLARVLLAQSASDHTDSAIDQAISLLDRLLIAAEAGGRMGSVIEILVLQALARQKHGDSAAARASLERALALAEPEGYTRIFVDEGPPMRELLREAAAGRAGGHARQVLSAFGEPSGALTAPAQASQPGLAEPLTAREIEVLRLIAAGMRNQEIADRLFISLPTVKRHVANAYGKLGAGHRTEAIAKANALNLL